MLTIQQLINRVEHDGAANIEQSRTLALLLIADALNNISASLDDMTSSIAHGLGNVAGSIDELPNVGGIADAIEKLAGAKE